MDPTEEIAGRPTPAGGLLSFRAFLLKLFTVRKVRLHPLLMLERNKYLVNHSSILLAVYNGSWRGSTAMTVRYAQKLGREIIVTNPKTRLVASFLSKI